MSRVLHDGACCAVLTCAVCWCVAGTATPTRRVKLARPRRPSQATTASSSAVSLTPPCPPRMQLSPAAALRAPPSHRKKSSTTRPRCYGASHTRVVLAACCLLPAVVRYRVHGRSPTLGSPPPPVCVPTRPRRRSRLPWQRTVRSSRPSARASGCRRSWRPGASVARALASWRMRRL